MVKFDTYTEDRNWGPLAVARKFFELYETDEPGEIRTGIGTIKWTASGDVGLTTITLHFTAENIENDFVMDNTHELTRGEKETAIGTRKDLITSQNFSSVGELGGDAGKLGKLIEDSINHAKRSVGDVTFEFAELDAASQGSQYLTSYEFEYEMVVIEPSVIERASVEEVV